MDVMVTFEDGTTELRPGNCPALASYDPTDMRPEQFTVADVVPARPAPVVSFRRPDRRVYMNVYTHAIGAWRGSEARVWCITGQDPETKALLGEWGSCRVESFDEQVARLTMERDHARWQRDGYHHLYDEAQRAADWRTDLAERLGGCIGVMAGNNNQPRVFLRGVPVELVAHHRALADMRLPASFAEAHEVRTNAIMALASGVSDPPPVSALVLSGRGDAPEGQAWSLDVVPEIQDEVEAHRETKAHLREAEERVGELESLVEELRGEAAKLSADLSAVRSALAMEGVVAPSLVDGVSVLGASLGEQARCAASMAAELAAVRQDRQRVLGDAALAKAFEGEFREEVDAVERFLSDRGVDEYEDVGDGAHRALRLSERVALAVTSAERSGRPSQPTLGELINARARAGAVAVEAREFASRIPKSAVVPREIAERRAAEATQEYEAAKEREAETQRTNRRGDGKITTNHIDTGVNID